MPKGWGPSARGVKSIAKEDPDAFKKKHDFDGRDFGDRGKQIAITIATTTKGRPQRTSTATTAIKTPRRASAVRAAPDQFKQGNRDQDDQGGGGQRKQKDFGAPGGPGGPDQFKQGNRDRSTKVAAASASRRTSGSQVDREGPISSSRATATRMIRAAVASASRRTLCAWRTGRPRSVQAGQPRQFRPRWRRRGQEEALRGARWTWEAPISSSRATATRMIRAAVASASRRTLVRPGGPGGPDQFKQGNRDNFDQGGGGEGKKKHFGEPGGPGGPDQFKQGNRDQDDQGGGGQRKQKDFGGGGPGGPGGPGGIKQFNQGGGQAQGDHGGGGDKKCQKHPEKPECQGRN